MTRVVATAGRGATFAPTAACPCGSGRLVSACHGLATPPDGAVAILGGRGPDAPKGDAGRCLVLDAGAGDAIHAMRYVASWRFAYYVVRRDMARLFAASFPGVRCVTAHPLPPAIRTVHALELIGQNPPDALIAPYLRGPEPAGFSGDGHLRVGICVRGDKTQVFDRWRSIHDVSVLVPLWAVPGVEWVDLAAGPFGDWADTANVVTGLDLVVSVDTGVAHLAGALGRPLLLLNRAPGPGDPGPDDRWDEGWLQPGPLYAGTRVIQQRRRGNWAEAIDTVVALVRQAT